MIGHILSSKAAATAVRALQARCCHGHSTAAAASAAASTSFSEASAAASVFPSSALALALERSSATSDSSVLLSNAEDKWPQQAAPALGATASLSAAHCFIRMSRCRRGLDLTDLPPLVALMRFRETCGLRPVVVLGDGSAACDDSEDKATANRSRADDDECAESLIAEIEKVFSIHEELAQRPLPKLRVHRNSEWYRTNIVDFLVQTGRQYRVENLRLELDGDAGVPSASLSAFSRIIMRAHDWKQVCSMYGPSLQVDGAYMNERIRLQTMRVALDHLRTRCDWNCIGLVLPPLHGSHLKAELVPYVLDDQLASCYDVYQHLQSVHDRIANRYLWMLTLDSMSDVTEVLSQSKDELHKRAAQQHVAKRVVSLLYGRDAPAKAELATELLFNRSRPLCKATAEELAAVRFCLRFNRMKYAEGLSLLDILMHVKCFVQPEDGSTEEDQPTKSRRIDRNLQVIRHEGFSVNAVPVNVNRKITHDDILPSGFTLLGRGRKVYHAIVWE